MKTLLMLLVTLATLPLAAQTVPPATNAPSLGPGTNATVAVTFTDADTTALVREAGRSLPPPQSMPAAKAGRATMGGPVVKAVKTKRPWDLINPFAPMSAGDGTNNLVPNSAGGPPGINIWSCTK